LVELAQTFEELCPNDDEAVVLTRRVLRDFSEWPGPGALRETWKSILSERATAEQERLRREQRAAAVVERDAHEATCQGFSVSVDDAEKTVSVGFCFDHFGERTGDVLCRKGGELREKDAAHCKRRLAQELADRPGWTSWGEWLERKYALKQARAVI
jgi:hypothetical protein